MKRFFGLDVHQNFIMVSAVDAEQNIVMKPRKITMDRFEEWVAKNVTAEDEVVIESMSGSWVIHDLLKQYAARVVVAHPYHVKLIASSFVKTDRRDSIALARLLAANILPEVWVPPQEVRQLRSLVNHRQTLIERRSAAKNRARGILAMHRIVGPSGAEAFRADYWQGVDIPSSEKLRGMHAVSEIKLLTEQIKLAEEELTRVSVSEYWVDDVPYLLQLPGVGLITAMTVLGAIGDIRRFPSAKKLVGYAGLGARVHSSGNTQQTGGITKQGRRELRYAMIEAAWNAIRYSDLWKERFERLAHRIGRQKAATAIARKLLVIIWNVLTNKAPDKNAVDNTVAKSMMQWGMRSRLATRLGMKTAEFARQKLDQLRLGFELDRVTFPSRVCALPPPAD